jgi:hypothetical protein
MITRLMITRLQECVQHLMSHQIARISAIQVRREDNSIAPRVPPCVHDRAIIESEGAGIRQ